MHSATTDFWSRFWRGDYADAGLMYRWFGVARIAGVVAFAFGVSALWALGVLDFNPAPIFVFLLPLYAASSFVWLWVARKRLFPEFFLHTQLAVDIGMITLGVYFSGGMHSEFVFFYLLPVVSASLISMAATVASAITALAFYVFLIYAEHVGLIAPAHGAHFGFQNDETIRVAIFAIIVALIAFQSHYYHSRARRAEKDFAKLKEDFLFRVVHDLRGPATAIRWIAEKYRNTARSFSTPSFLNDMELVREANGRMLALVRDLGEIVRGESVMAAPKKERVELSGVIARVAQELEPAMRERGVRLRYEPGVVPPAVVGDERIIQEVFGNLLDNAVKYNTAGGLVSVGFAEEDGRVITRIGDTGPGIAPEDLPKLFTPYFRSRAGVNTAGTGLGLFIVKKLVEKMNGSVRVDSVVGHGATFSVALPRADAASAV